MVETTLVEEPCQSLSVEDRVRRFIDSSDVIVLDIESTGLDPLHDTIEGIAFFDGKTADFLPPDNPTVADFLRDLITVNRTRKVLFHNALFDLNFLCSYLGISPRQIVCPVEDSMVCHYLYQTDASTHALKEIVHIEYGVQLNTWEQVKEDGLDLAEYSMLDARWTWEIWQKYRKLIEEDGQGRVYAEIDIPCIPVLIEMERTGMLIDRPYLESLGVQLRAESARLIAKLKEYAGPDFNPASPQQVGQFLYGTLGIEPPKVVLAQPKKTDTPTTARAALEAIEGKHPAVAALLRYRKITKWLSTYVEPFLKRTESGDGRLHSEYTLTVTATARLSSRRPNLQNIPKDKDLFRRAFIASPGRVLCLGDYGQLELRIVAHYSQDSTMLDAFKYGKDIHATTSTQLGVERRLGKNINFGLLYGLGPRKFAQMVKISFDQARTWRKAFFSLYPRLKNYYAWVWRCITEQGYVASVTGRKRKFVRELLIVEKRDYEDPTYPKNEEHRMAVNSCIQSSAGDVAKLAMRNLWRRLISEGHDDVLFINQVHDEIILECPEGKAQAVAAMLKEAMETCLTLRVPLEANVGIGKNWDEAKP